jgi:hypothetical protein
MPEVGTMSALKSTVIVLMSFLFVSAQAQTPNRNDLVNQIEEGIGKPAPVTEKSPLVTTTLTAAKNANPGVDSLTWDEVSADTAVALTMEKAIKLRMTMSHPANRKPLQRNCNLRRPSNRRAPSIFGDFIYVPCDVVV